MYTRNHFKMWRNNLYSTSTTLRHRKSLSASAVGSCSPHVAHPRHTADPVPRSSAMTATACGAQTPQHKQMSQLQRAPWLKDVLAPGLSCQSGTASGTASYVMCAALCKTADNDAGG